MSGRKYKICFHIKCLTQSQLLIFQYGVFKNFKQLELLSGNTVHGFPKLFYVSCFEIEKENLCFSVFNSKITKIFCDNKYLPKCELMEPFKKGIGFNDKNMTRGPMKQY